MILEILKKIEFELDKAPNNRISLVGGQAGIILFYFYYGKYKNNDYYYQKGFDLLYDLFNSIKSTKSTNYFASGYSGILWAVNHLERNGFIKLDDHEFIEEFEKHFIDSLNYSLKQGHYDYFYGALGILFYFLSSPNVHKLLDLLEQSVRKLEEFAIIEVEGTLKWESVISISKRQTGISLGLSHGLASIISVLKKYYLLNPTDSKVEQIIDHTIKYLMDQKLSDSENSIFPSYILNDGTNSGSSRLAWCNGDLGIGYAIFQASKTFNRDDWESLSMNILKHSAKRRGLNKNKVFDASFCHGTSGIAHIFNRLYHEKKMEVFKNAADYWFNQTIITSKFHNNKRGYQYYLGQEDVNWRIEHGILEGIAGIGLTLISKVSDIEPAWDELFLLS